jgi:hypothetical protein
MEVKAQQLISSWRPRFGALLGGEGVSFNDALNYTAANAMRFVLDW